MIFYNLWSLFLLILGILSITLSLYFYMINYMLFMDWKIMGINYSFIVMTMFFDWISLLFMGSVLLISSMVIFYKGSYMLMNLFMIRFIILVLLFVFSVLLMIVSPNLVSILLGWDGLGLVSYCLVIYFQNYKWKY